jgi:hypothetical protein
MVEGDVLKPQSRTVFISSTGYLVEGRLDKTAYSQKPGGR